MYGGACLVQGWHCKLPFSMWWFLAFVFLVALTQYQCVYSTPYVQYRFLCGGLAVFNGLIA